MARYMAILRTLVAERVKKARGLGENFARMSLRHLRALATLT